jgi:peptidoglycan/LPS O-acetylase OafA/YrhL
LLPLSVLCWSTIFIEDSKLINLSFLELAGEWIKYCAVFIDLFFIISGFVIALSVSNKSVSYFFKSRVVRLFSVYWLCAFITYMVTVFFGAPRFHATLGQFLFNLTLLQDFFDVERLDGAYWTMSVELRFYALALGYLILYRYKKIKISTIAYIYIYIYMASVISYLSFSSRQYHRKSNRLVPDVRTVTCIYCRYVNS